MRPRTTDDSWSDAFPDIPGFAIDGVLGRGSMAVVYRALQRGIERPVALKVLRRGLVPDDVSARRLLKEARMAARFNHPNVIRVLDAGVHDGVCWLVMDRIEGRTLKEIVEQDGPLSEAVARRVGLEIAEVLRRCEREGIVHRDVKPGNIMIDGDGHALLGDFGLATIPMDLRYDADRRAVGTPAYMSPEQASAPATVDIRSDLFSLGATLYYATTGVSPFEAPTVAEVVTRILYEDPPPVRSLRPELGADFEATLRRLVAKRPEDRHADVAALEADLRVAPPRERVWPAALTAALLGAVATAIVLVAALDRDDAPDGGAADRTTRRADAPPRREDPADLSVVALAERVESAPFDDRAELDARIEAAADAAFGEARAYVAEGRFDAAEKAYGEATRHVFARALGVRWDDLPASLRVAYETRRLDGQALLAAARSAREDEALAALELVLAEEVARLGRRDLFLDADAAGRTLAETVATALADGPVLTPAARARADALGEAARDALMRERRREADAALERIETLGRRAAFAPAARELDALAARHPERLDPAYTARLAALSTELAAARERTAARLADALAAVDAAAAGPAPLARPEFLDQLPQSEGELGELGAAVARLRAMHHVDRVLFELRDRLWNRAPALAGRVRPTVETLGGERVEGRLFVGLAEARDAVVLGADRAHVIPIVALRPASIRAILGEETGPEPRLELWAAWRAGELFAVERLLGELDGDDALADLVAARLDEAFARRHEVRDAADREALRTWLAARAALRADDHVRALALAEELKSAHEGSAWAAANARDIDDLARRARATGDLLGRFPDTARVRIEDLGARRVRWEWRAAGELPAPFEPVENGVRRVRPAADVVPTAVEALVIPVELDPNLGPIELDFAFIGSEAPAEAPRWLAISLAGRHVCLLSRLERRERLEHLPLHGLDAGVRELVPFGVAAAWKGELAGCGAALRAALGGGPRVLLEGGRRHRVRLGLEDQGRSLRLHVDGEPVLDRVDLGAQGAATRSTSIEIRAPMPHRIEDLVVTGTLRAP